jgi:LPXTG-site transpeptidase (sortase) family protein
MIDWLIVLGALSGGLALTLWLVTLQIRLSPAQTWLGRWLAFGLANLALGLAFGGCRGEALTPIETHPAQRATPGNAFVSSSPAGSLTTQSPALATPLLKVGSAVSVWPVASGITVEAEPTAPAPARLRIPTLGVDESIVPISIHDGEWDLSNLGLGVGQLATTGAYPGDEWAMVFIGHMTLSAVQHGPFAYLQNVSKDAEVIYSVGDQEYVYRVRALSRVPPDAVRELYLRDPHSLLLVTCTDWDGNQRVYANRLLVRAELVSAPEAAGASR